MPAYEQALELSAPTTKATYLRRMKHFFEFVEASKPNFDQDRLLCLSEPGHGSHVQLPDPALHAESLTSPGTRGMFLCAYIKVSACFMVTCLCLG